MSILNGNRKKGQQSQVGGSIVQVGLAATMASMLSACGGGGGESSTTDTSKSDQPVSLTMGGSSANFLLEGTDADLNAPLKQFLLASGASDQGIDEKVSSLKSDLFGDDVKNYKIEVNGENIHFASTDTSGVSSMRTLVQKKDQDGSLTHIELVAHGPGNGDLTTQTLFEVAASVPKLQSYIFVEGKNGIEFFIKGGSSDAVSKSVNVNKSTDDAYTTDSIKVKGKDDQLLFTIGEQNERTSTFEFLKNTNLTFDNMEDELVFSIRNEDEINNTPTYIAMMQNKTNVNVSEMIKEVTTNDIKVSDNFSGTLDGLFIDYEIYNNNSFGDVGINQVVSSLGGIFENDGYVSILPTNVKIDNSGKFDVTYALFQKQESESKKEATIKFLDSSLVDTLEKKAEALLNGEDFKDTTGNSLLAEITIGNASEIVRFQMDNLDGNILNGVDKLDVNNDYEYTEYMLNEYGMIDKELKHEDDFFSV